MSELRVRPIVQNSPSGVNGLVWVVMAGCIALMLVVLPRISDAAADAAYRHAEDVASENHALCEKWGFPEGSRQHSACLGDLVDLREKIRQDAVAEMVGVL